MDISGGYTISQGFSITAPPPHAEGGDTYFPYTTLLLPGTGTNNAQNNTFLDGSTNNFAITRNGNTTQGTFSPYGPNWSNYFDGNDYLSVGSNTAFGMGTGNFTVESWVLPTAYSGSDFECIFDFRATNRQSAFGLFYNSSYLLQAFDGPSDTLFGSGTLQKNAWNHVALTRSGTTWTLWLNGVSQGTRTSGNNLGSSQPLFIGTAIDNPGVTRTLIGYQSNFRVVKGTAVYTTAFTPPTSLLTAIANTSLLTCQSNRFIDTSSNAFTITVNGNTNIQRFSPFSPTQAYSTSTTGGSGYFDGSSSLSVATNAAFNLAADFTIECWVYMTTASGTKTIFTNRTSHTNATGLAWVTQSGSQAMSIYVNGFGLVSSIVIPLNTWTHVALTRSGTTMTQWVNGVSGGTLTQNNVFSDAQCYIGVSNTSTEYWPGYISNFRIVKGTAVYTAAFTPPTAPLTAIANTSILLNYTNAGIIDNTMLNNLETVGNAQLSTAVKKYGSASMYFDGTGDYLTLLPTQSTAFGTGDFTIEFWVNPSTKVGTYPGLFGNQTFTANSFVGYERHGSYPTKFSIFCYNYSSAGAMLISTTTVSTDTWYHIAITRNGSNFRLFVNGAVEATATFAGSVDGNVPLRYIGCDYITNTFAGYIDDLRITKGYARYTSNFTAPTSAFITR